MVIYSSLIHDPVRDMTDVDFSVYGEISGRDRAVPNVMIALSMPYKITSVFTQNFADFFLVLRHYAKTA
jgi:hypothetical protein